VELYRPGMTIATLVPLLTDPQAAEILAKSGFLKKIGTLLVFGLVILVLIGVFIGFKARGRRR
jgi:cytochrome c biogenesis protein ResB